MAGQIPEQPDLNRPAWGSWLDEMSSRRLFHAKNCIQMMFYGVLSPKIFGLGNELPGTSHLLSKQVGELFIALKVNVSLVKTLGFDCSL